MRKATWAMGCALLLLPVFANAQNAFDGTWKVDMSKVDFPKKPDVYVLQNGMYDCKTCVPPYQVKADGEDQKVSGHPYFDSIAIKVVNDHEIEETDKKDGKVVYQAKSTVASDGKTMMFEFTDSTATNSAPVIGKGEAMRVAKGPAGSNAISGSWRTTKVQDISDNGISWTYKVNGDELTMTSPTGQSFSAKMNGMEAPMKGDPGVTTVAVKMMGKNKLEQTNMFDGKAIGTATSMLSSDGKTLNVTYDDKQHGTTMKYVATRQ